MRAERAGEDLSSAIWQAGLEETARIERKAKRPPLPEGMTKKACRKAVSRQLRKLNEADPSAETRAQAAWIGAKCRRCRACHFAPD